MRKIALVGIVLLCALGAPGLYPRALSRPTPGQDILARRITLHLSKATMNLALSNLAVQHRVPIGIERSLSHSDDEKLNLDFDAVTLKEVLDSIVEQEPLYRWERVDGVINFVPARERDPFVEAFLNTPVAHFDPGKWNSIFQVRNAIGDIPEVKRMLEANRKTIDKYGDYVKYPSIYTRDDVDLSISNTTVRGVLNRVIRDSEHTLWSIGWVPGDKEALSIRF
jgi:hypothetical protein